MTNPRHYLFFMFVYLIIVAVVCGLLYAPLKDAFMANWGFNLLILGVLAVGIVINMFQVLRLEPEINWIQMFRTGEVGLSVAHPPKLLNPLARHLSEIHRDRFRLSALSLQTVLEGIRGRLEESREISRYIIGLLIFLGLLGTFWGLLETIGDVAQVISALEVGTENMPLFFENLKSGLQEPLQGMGTAFSSSLFGLGGSLVLGFLDIQAGHAQNRFFNEMEEWLTGVTSLIDKDVAPDEKTGRSLPEADRNQYFIESLIAELKENNRRIEKLLHEHQSEGPASGTNEGDEN
ncbi:MAG: biopolymer transporter ExbB [Desulfobacteraceae bacterium]|nr:biopolymer transporter ExbB [Desulfobacteraceae bacterium]